MLTPVELQALLRLARLEVPADRQTALLEDLEGILGHMEDLKAVDTRGVTPVAHPLGLVLPTRPDAVRKDGPSPLASSPHGVDGHLRVPRILE